MIVSVSSLLQKDFFTITPLASLQKAQRIILEENIGCLPVEDEGKIVGILTKRDIMSNHPNRIIADAMSSPVVSISPDTSIWEAKKIFEVHDIERLLVIKNNKLYGLIDRTSLYAELGKHTNSLTGLYGSHYLYHKGLELFEQGLETSVIFIDLNQFGAVNKKYGHVIGDMIIKKTSDILFDIATEECSICRYGGDEFVILTPYTLEPSIKLAKDMVNAISKHAFTDNIRISACAGITMKKSPDSTNRDFLLQTLRDLINFASLASTQAKNQKQSIMVISEDKSVEIA